VGSRNKNTNNGGCDISFAANSDNTHNKNLKHQEDRLKLIIGAIMIALILAVASNIK
jgi:hypothetical protein